MINYMDSHFTLGTHCSHLSSSEGFSTKCVCTRAYLHAHVFVFTRKFVGACVHVFVCTCRHV